MDERRRDYPEIKDRLIVLETTVTEKFNAIGKNQDEFYKKIDGIHLDIKEIKSSIVSLDKTTCLMITNLNGKIKSYEPVRKVVYGLVGIILTGAVVAWLALIKK